MTKSSETETGLLPEQIKESVGEFTQLISWKRVPGSTAEVPEPQPGIDEDFDNANQEVMQVKEALNDYLKGIVARFKDRRIQFSHAKMRYELEIPEEHVKGNKKPKEFELTSQRAGYQRFHTPALKQLVEQLENAEDRLKDAMSPFLTAIFKRFHEQKTIWCQILQVLTELDCLASLSIASG